MPSRTLRCSRHPKKHVFWERIVEADKWCYCPYCSEPLLRDNVPIKLYRLAKSRYSDSQILIKKFYLDILGISERLYRPLVVSGLKPHQVLATRNLADTIAGIGPVFEKQLDEAILNWVNAN